MTSAWAAAERRAETGEAPTRSSAAKRGKGHPKLSDPINWTLGQKLYLHGGTRGADGRTAHMSLETIGERLGCSKQAVAARAKREGWADQREALEEGERAQAVRDALVSGARPTLAPGQVLDAYLALFEKAVLAGRVRLDSFPDFERAVTMKRRLEAEDRVATERAGTVSLDRLRDLHRAHADAEGGLTDEASGVLAHGTGAARGSLEGADNLAPSDGADPPEGGEGEPAPVAATVGKRQSAPKPAGKPSGKARGK